MKRMAGAIGCRRRRARRKRRKGVAVSCRPKKRALPETVVIGIKVAQQRQSRFRETRYAGVAVRNDWERLPAQNTSVQSTYSYAVVNRGDVPAIVQVQISPNAVDYANDIRDEVQPGSTLVIVPTRFLKYTRLCAKTVQPERNTTLDVYFQSQSPAS